jgi:Family of unknown function (DUF6600)
MRRFKNIALILALLLLGFATANAGASFSINVGSGGYYQPVGDYDYLPYAYQTYPGYAAPRINFYDMMSQYGGWVNVPPFGQVWKPYASNDWRPYTYGHWISTQQYGQMWEGYEPWAWAGYHYGNWIFDRYYGWVWIPGYEWHPGQVAWARSNDSIGWMPLPPSGYDYSQGYLSNVGPNNQFGYNDNNFGSDFGYGNYNQGGPYNDPRYRNMYYNPGYNNIVINLWIFVGNSHYGNDNYSNYYLGPNYTRDVFNRRLVRITNRQIDRAVLERVVGQRLRETAVEVKQLQTDKQNIRVVVPVGNDVLEQVRKNSKEVVRDIIAPGFAEKQKGFVGQNSKNKQMVSKIFNQEKVKPKVETLSTEQIINQAREAKQIREQNRIKIEQVQKEKLDSIAKEEKLQEPKKTNSNGAPGNNSQLQDKDQKQKEVAKKKEHDAQVLDEDEKHKHQQQIDSEQKAKEKDSVKQAQTESTKESDNSSDPDSKDKKSKAKPHDNTNEQEQPPQR